MNTKRKPLFRTALMALATLAFCLGLGCVEKSSSDTYTLTVLASPASGGTVTPETALSIASGKSVNVSAAAAEGYVFQGWSVTRGDAEIADPSSASTSVTVSSNSVVTANFRLESEEPPPPTGEVYTLSVSASPAVGGTVSPIVPASVESGTPFAISAAASEGYSFQGWAVTEGDVSFDNPGRASTTVTLASDAAIAALFEKLPDYDDDPDPDGYTLITGVNPANSGNVAPRSKSGIEPGATVSVSATPAAGYQFVNWSVAEGEIEFANPSAASTPVVLSSDAEITANFSLRPYTLTVKALPEAGGTVSPTSRPNTTMGTEVGITATPAAGYAFTGWSVSGTGAVVADPSSSTTTVTMGSSNATVTARFHVPAARYTVTFDTDGGTPASIGSVTVDDGTALRADFPANPTKTGYRFDGWFSDNGVRFTSSTQITYGVELKAKWTQLFTVSFNSNGGVPEAIANVIVGNGETLGALLPSVTRDGYAFKGWFEGDEGLYMGSRPITRNVALAAKWALIFTDPRDGKVYGGVTIGTQTWMDENLNFEIETITGRCYDVDPENCTVVSRCYDDDPANCAVYGRLYSWKAAVSACPEGWHLPSDEELSTLSIFAGGAAEQLKSVSGWNNDLNGIDKYGFSAMPAGTSAYGTFNAIGTSTIFWSATSTNPPVATSSNAYYFGIGSGGVVMRYSSKESGIVLLSVRCLKDIKD